MTVCRQLIDASKEIFELQRAEQRYKILYYTEFFTFTTVDLLKLNSVPAWSGQSYQ